MVGPVVLPAETIAELADDELDDEVLLMLTCRVEDIDASSVGWASIDGARLLRDASLRVEGRQRSFVPVLLELGGRAVAHRHDPRSGTPSWVSGKSGRS